MMATFPCDDPDPIRARDGDLDPGEHDARCAIWMSDNVEDCDCPDVDGYRPPVRLTDSPTMRAAVETLLACDEDPDERVS